MVKSKNTHVTLPPIGPQGSQKTHTAFSRDGSAKHITTASDITTSTLKQPLSRGPTIYQQLFG
ncbi:hypothetical protein OROGR_007338 [Orobanche gracilis]